MLKISGKVEKPNTYNVFNSNISFFILVRTSLMSACLGFMANKLCRLFTTHLILYK